MFSTKKTDQLDANKETHPGESIEGFPSDEQLLPSEASASRPLKPSVISEGFSFNGDIQSLGQLTVDGEITGSISVENLIIGVSGSVNGTVQANTINVKGRLYGKVRCDEIIVGGRSIVDGDLTYSSITTQRGGVVKGDIRKSPVATSLPLEL